MMDAIWEQLFSSQDWGKYPPEHVIRFIARTFYRSANRKDVKILEVGCGNGANIWYLAKEGFDAYGIDGSPSAIQCARERIQCEGLSANLIVGDFCAKLPWPTDFFDGVLENVSLYANRKANIKMALAEIHRVLRPGGKFQSSWFTPKTWGYRLGLETEPGGFESITDGPLHNRGFCLFIGESELRQLLKDFHIESIETTSYTLNDRIRLIDQWVAVAHKL